MATLKLNSNIQNVSILQIKESKQKSFINNKLPIFQKKTFLQEICLKNKIKKIKSYFITKSKKIF
jgi:hypothetical protein